jgi:hypothetical protein
MRRSAFEYEPILIQPGSSEDRSSKAPALGDRGLPLGCILAR